MSYANINKALDFGQRYGKTDGRKRIIELGLDSESTANKVISVYNKVVLTKMDSITNHRSPITKN